MSYGQDLLCEYLKLLSKHKFITNYRPDWLIGLEIDIYFEELKYGIEFNGDQHYYISEFGNPLKQIKNDQRKRSLCKMHGVKLISLQAIDLVGSMISGKLGHLRPRLITKGYAKINKTHILELNKKSISYRKLLISKYNSPTSRKRKSKVRDIAAIPVLI